MFLIETKGDPVKISNFQGKATGIYYVPSLTEMSIFAVKKHFSPKNIEKMIEERKIPEDLQEKIRSTSEKEPNEKSSLEFSSDVFKH